MSFQTLPKVIKNVICDFAFCSNWEKTSDSLQMCEKLLSYDISPLFLRLQMWSCFYKRYMPSPFLVFEPIEHFDRWSDIVDWNAVNELLHRLDYRRKFVKIGGTRTEWFDKFRKNWTAVRMFDAFYRVLLHSRVKCFKPTFQTQRTLQLRTGFYSPIQTARWILDDYRTWGR